MAIKISGNTIIDDGRNIEFANDIQVGGIIHNTVDNNFLRLEGGLRNASGAEIRLYGPNHGTFNNYNISYADIYQFRNNAGTVFATYDTIAPSFDVTGSFVINNNTTSALDLRRPATTDYLGIAYRDNTTVRWLQYAANNATADLIWQSRDANGTVIGSAMVLRNATRNAEFYGDVDIISGDIILNTPGQRIWFDTDSAQDTYIEAKSGVINIGVDAEIRFIETDNNWQQITLDLNTGSITANGTITGTEISYTSHSTVFGGFSTSSYVESGRGSGGVALTVNDGYGNANITFNHRSGVPEQNGNAARITFNADETTDATMLFQLGTNVTSGVAANVSTVFALNETGSILLSNLDLTGALNVSGNTGIGTNVPESLLHVSGGDIRFTNNVIAPATQSRTKYWVWNSPLYGIGMQDNFQYGGLSNNSAMTFQMNNANARGFWWGDDAHANNQGAMALTTDGRLTVAKAIRVGFGESDTITPGTVDSTAFPGRKYNLQVVGDIEATSFVATGNDGFVWENGVSRITHNDGGGNAQIRFGHKYSGAAGGTVYTHAGGAVSMKSNIDATANTYVLWEVSTNPGAGEGNAVTWTTPLRLEEGIINIGPGETTPQILKFGPADTYISGRTTGITFELPTDEYVSFGVGSSDYLRIDPTLGYVYSDVEIVSDTTNVLTSHVVFTDHTNNNPATRLINTSYQATKTTFVAIKTSNNATGVIQLSPDGVAWYTIITFTDSGTYFCVPTGWYYRIFSGGVQSWYEWS